MRRFAAIIILTVCLASTVSAFQTGHVVIVVMDGVKYTETFGNDTHQFIPRIWNWIRPNATIYTGMQNNHNVTVTRPGHSAIITGFYQPGLDNVNGTQEKPSIFELLRKKRKISNETTWFVLHHYPQLRDLNRSDKFGDAYSPREVWVEDERTIDDNVTFNLTRKVLRKHHVDLMMVNFGWTDSQAHQDDWTGYLAATWNTDRVTYWLWQTLQKSPKYSNHTTMIIVNDHGRHIRRFRGHGDDCEGCRHVMCLVIGPDTPGGHVRNDPTDISQIAPTVAKLMNVSRPSYMPGPLPGVFS